MISIIVHVHAALLEKYCLIIDHHPAHNGMDQQKKFSPRTHNSKYGTVKSDDKYCCIVAAPPLLWTCTHAIKNLRLCEKGRTATATATALRCYSEEHLHNGMRDHILRVYGKRSSTSHGKRACKNFSYLLLWR